MNANMKEVPISSHNIRIPTWIWEWKFVNYQHFAKLSIEVSFSYTSTDLLAMVYEDKKFQTRSDTVIL